MNRHRTPCLLLAVCFLLAFTPVWASGAPRAGNPCKQIRQILDRQVDDLKTQQQDELRQCEQSNGRGSAACLNLREQQRQALRAMRDSRTGQMNSCNGGGVSWIATAVPGSPDIANSYYNQANPNYPDNDNYPAKRPDPHPRHPHRPPVEAAAADKQPHGFTEHSGKSSHTTTAAGGSQSGGSASSGGHSHSGGGSSAGSYGGSGHSSGSGGSSSSSGGSSSGGSHSSGGGSSYSGGSSSGASSSGSSSSSSSSSAGHSPR